MLTQRQKENILRNFIMEALKDRKYSGSYPDESYGNGNVKDMLLDEEGWITDPNDRKKIKKWYLDMGLSYK